MAITIQNQKFGVEIELTGITRETAAKTIADYYGTAVYMPEVLTALIPQLTIKAESGKL